MHIVHLAVTIFSSFSKVTQTKITNIAKMGLFSNGQFTKKNARCDNKVIIVTGCNTGIGKETVLELAKRGGRIYMACRNLKKCDEARAEIMSITGNHNIFSRSLDLASLESVRTFVENFKKEEQRLDILINNAGIMNVPQGKTVDGFEMHFGVNHLAHFLLTNLLLDLLTLSAPSRIITLSSSAHLMGNRTIKRDDLNLEQSYSPFKAYCQSKLANILFTRELAKRLAGTKVVANSVHPGIVKTDLIREDHIMNKILYSTQIFMKTPKSGAQTTLAVALDPDLQEVTGRYFVDCEIAKESSAAQDDDSAAWLWRASERLTGMIK